MVVASPKRTRDTDGKRDCGGNVPAPIHTPREGGGSITEYDTVQTEATSEFNVTGMLGGRVAKVGSLGLRPEGVCKFPATPEQ